MFYFAELKTLKVKGAIDYLKNILKGAINYLKNILKGAINYIMVL